MSGFTFHDPLFPRRVILLHGAEEEVSATFLKIDIDGVWYQTLNRLTVGPSKTGFHVPPAIFFEKVLAILATQAS